MKIIFSSKIESIKIPFLHSKTDDLCYFYTYLRTRVPYFPELVMHVYGPFEFRASLGTSRECA